MQHEYQVIGHNNAPKFTNCQFNGTKSRGEMIRELMEAHSAALRGCCGPDVIDADTYRLAAERYELAVDDLLDNGYTMTDISRLLKQRRKGKRND